MNGFCMMSRKNIMKRSTLILILSLLFWVSSCKKKETEVISVNTDTTEQPEKFVIDSVAVRDSAKITENLSANYESKMLVFPSIKNKMLLDSIYYSDPAMNDFSKEGMQTFIENDKKEFFTSVKDKSLDFAAEMMYPQKWESSSAMKVISQDENFLQIEYLYSSYEGGAHGNYVFSERVFDLKNNKKLDLKDITTMPQAKLEQILTANIDKIPSGTTDSNGVVKNSEMQLVDKIPANSNFHFDDKNLYFHYSPYEIAAYAAGDILIPISWKELEGTLNPEFKKRMKIN